MTNPTERKKQRLRQRKWRSENAQRYRDYHRAYFHSYKLKKLEQVPWQRIFFSAKQRAKKRQVEFDLDFDWFKARWTGRCELTNIRFTPPHERTGYKRKNFSPSIDRISPDKGYTKDNCRIVLWAVNCLKQDGTDVDMYRISLALIRNRPRSDRIC